MIEWNKSTNTKSNSTSDYIRKMENEVDDLCDRLTKDSKDFDAKLFLIRCMITFNKRTGYYILI